MWRKVEAEPKIIGEHLRRKRIDMGFTNVQVAQILGVCYQTVERWEHNRCPMLPRQRAKVVAFLGYDPGGEKENPADDGSAGILKPPYTCWPSVRLPKTDKRKLQF